MKQLFYLIFIQILILLFIGSCIPPTIQKQVILDNHGAIIRMDTSERMIYLVFTGHEYAEGFSVINNALEKHNIKASFFFTGDFYRNTDFEEIIKTIKIGGHYLGAHSDKHLLYNSWEKRDSLLVSKEEFMKDLSDNYDEMKRLGIIKENAEYFLPPYEWYNSQIATWTTEANFKLINFTPGTSSNQDWTFPNPGSYYISSDTILLNILNYEENKGMNGFILLSHIGTDPRRIDKFYFKMDTMIHMLKQRGYDFSSLVD